MLTRLLKTTNTIETPRILPREGLILCNTLLRKGKIELNLCHLRNEFPELVLPPFTQLNRNKGVVANCSRRKSQFWHRKLPSICITRKLFRNLESQRRKLNLLPQNMLDDFKMRAALLGVRHVMSLVFVGYEETGNWNFTTFQILCFVVCHE